MNKFEDTYNRIDAMLEEGKLKSLATAGILGLGALGGTSDAEATPLPRSSSYQRIDVEAEARKIKNPEETLNISDPLMLSIISELYKWEIAGKEYKAFYPYDDSAGKPTIGIGHLIKAGEDFSQGLTAEEVLELFIEDIEKRIRMAERMFDGWGSFPEATKVALINGIYRGDIKSRHETVKLINIGNWLEASKEYLDHDEYKQLKKSKGNSSQIVRRMESNASIMKATAKYMNRGR